MENQEEKRRAEYSPELQVAMDQLLQNVQQHEAIQDYQKIALKIEKNEVLRQLVEEIKQHQKDAVNFAHYDKPQAEQEAIRLANQKQKEFDEHPLVIVYREKLIEANDILQHLTHLLEHEFNQRLEEHKTNEQ